MNFDLIGAMSALDEERTLTLVENKIIAGMPAFEIVEQCRKGVEIVGKRYTEGAYYLADLIMAEEIFKGVIDIIEPYFPLNTTENGPKIVMGTIEGDIHDLGKNITVFILRSLGYVVYDLGVDVPADQFVSAIKETGAQILGISVLLTYCIHSIKKVVTLLEEVGLRSNVQILIGGSPVNQRIMEHVGADYYVNEISSAVDVFKSIMNAPAPCCSGIKQ